MKKITLGFLSSFLMLTACAGTGADDAAAGMAADVEGAVAPAAAGAMADQSAPESEQEWTQLFNGRDLEGWDVKLTGHDLNDNFGNTFRVEDGLLKVRYDQYDDFGNKFGHIFHQEKFSHYLLAVEYRFVGEQVSGGAGWALRNNGVMVHSQSAASMLKDQNFPISIEVQLLGGLGSGPRSTANLCTPGTDIVMNGERVTRHCINSSSETYEGDQWVRVEILVLGDSLITHSIDGQVVMEYSRPQIGGGSVANFDPDVKIDGQPLTEGYISLQAESHPADFRKIEIIDLSSSY